MIKLTATVDQKELDRYLAKLDKNRGKPLLYRAENTTYAAARLLVPPVRAKAPLGNARLIGGALVKPGKLRASVKQKRLRKQGSEDIRPTWVGATSWYSAWVQMGTRSHPLARKREGKSDFAAFGVDEVRPLAGMPDVSAKAHPFVQPGAEPHLSDVYTLIARDVFSVK